LKCKLNFFIQNENKNEDSTVHMLTFESDSRLYIEFHVFVYVHNLSLHNPHQFRARFHADFSNPRLLLRPARNFDACLQLHAFSAAGFDLFCIVKIISIYQFVQ